MKTFFQILALGLVHLFLLATFFSIGIVAQGGFLSDVDITETSRVISAISFGIVRVLAFPGFYILSIISKPVNDLLEWSIVILNSLLFGTVAVFIIRAIKTVIRNQGSGNSKIKDTCEMKKHR